MKKILVPTDFSPNALRAIHYAVEIAKRNQASICLVHVTDALLDNVFPGQEKITEDYNNTIVEQADINLNNLRNSIQEAENITVETQLLNGPIKDSIRLAAAARQADLVIMGTMGKSGLKEQILGSKTASVISHSEKPVLAIPLEYEWSTPVKILLAIKDYSEAETVLQPVMELATIFNAELQLAIFTDENRMTAIGYRYDDEALHLTEEKIKKAHPSLHARAVHLSGKNFVETLNEYIHANSIDVVCMITHHRNFIDNLFNRSLTKKMAYQSKVPVLAIPAG